MTNRKSTADKRDCAKVSTPSDKARGYLIDTISDPDVDTDPAEEIEEKGEPFEGNHA